MIAGSLPRGDDSAASRKRRIAAYLARIPPAFSGQHGHDRTFPAACVLVKGFRQTLDEARPCMGQVTPRAYAPLFPGFSGVFMENITGSYNVT